jgi:hypothetical protein
VSWDDCILDAQLTMHRTPSRSVLTSPSRRD